MGYGQMRLTGRRLPQRGMQPVQLSLFADPAETPVQRPRPSLRVVPAPLDQPVAAPTHPRAPPPPLTLVESPAGPVGSRTARLAGLVSQSAGVHVHLVITDNRHTLLSWRQDDHSGLHVVRAHHMFLDAPDHVGHAVGRWMVCPGAQPESRLLDDFMADNRHLVTRDRRPLGPAAGRFHDLQRVYDDLNAAEFAGQVDARIGWGESGTPRRSRRRTIQLGCYDPEARTISVHPALDQKFVPAFFVAAVVFHEMLHQQVPVAEEGGRRCVHSAEFRRREEMYADHHAALVWQARNLGKLLRFNAPAAGGAGRRGARR